MNGMLSVAITHRCNLRCRHCYVNAGVGGRETSLCALHDFLERFMECFAPCTSNIDVELTGGEPLLRFEDTIALLTTAAKHFSRRPGDALVLNTNGTLLEPAHARRLAEIPDLKVWVSLDGDQRAHEELRGPESFGPALTGLSNLAACGVWVGVGLFPTPENLSVLLDAAALALDHGAKRFVVQKPMYLGRWKNASKDFLFTSMSESLEKLHAQFGDAVASPLSAIKERAKTHLPNGRVGDNTPPSCTLDRNVSFHLVPDGRIFPCYALVETPFSIGALEDWPRDLPEYERRMQPFLRHNAWAEASWVPMPDELSFCPATVVPNGATHPYPLIG